MLWGDHLSAKMSFVSEAQQLAMLSVAVSQLCEHWLSVSQMAHIPGGTGMDRVTPPT